MSTTIVPDPDSVREDLTPNDILVEVHRFLLEAQGDADKAGDPEDNAYYQGMVDACRGLEIFLTQKE